MSLYWIRPCGESDEAAAAEESDSSEDEVKHLRS
jgi:hypothetical protein